MHKDEIIHLHQLLVNVMKFLVDNGIPRENFRGYMNLGISPHQIYRTKGEHKRALFTLSYLISRILAENNEIVPQSVVRKLEEINRRLHEEEK